MKHHLLLSLLRRRARSGVGRSKSREATTSLLASAFSSEGKMAYQAKPIQIQAYAAIPALLAFTLGDMLLCLATLHDISCLPNHIIVDLFRAHASDPMLSHHH